MSTTFPLISFHCSRILHRISQCVHLVVLLLNLFLYVTFPQSFSFMSLTLWKAPISYSVKCPKMCGFPLSPHDGNDIIYYGKNTREMMFWWCAPLSASHQGVHDIKIYITSDVYFDHLVKVHSASFEAMQLLFLLYLLPSNFSIHKWM